MVGRIAATSTLHFANSVVASSQDLLTETTTVVGEVVSQLRLGGRKSMPDLLPPELSEVSRRVAKLSRAGEPGMAALVEVTTPTAGSTLSETCSWIWSAASVGLDDRNLVQAGASSTRPPHLLHAADCCRQLLAW